MKKNLKKILFLLMLLIPTIVCASDQELIPLEIALYVEAFITPHISIFLLWPLSLIFGKESKAKFFWKLFIGRVLILLFFDFFITTSIVIFDCFLIFIGILLMVFSAPRLFKNNNVVSKVITPIKSSVPEVDGIELKCAKCSSVLPITAKFCPNCGVPFEGDNVVVSENSNSSIPIPQKVFVTPSQFDNMYSMSEEKLLETFINSLLIKAGVDTSLKLIPSDVLRKKQIFNILFSVLFFIFISLIFFHFPISTYIIGIVILIIFFKATRKYDFIKYLKKQIKARPNEKILNIIMTVKSSFVSDNSNKIFFIGLLTSIILPLIIFFTPNILYERVDGGYAVRYYTFGLTNFKTAEIPNEYKGEKVVSLRGNTFSNMPFLESVVLPDTIVEIRGQAFKNCINLVGVNIPSKLEYLGGAAFYNAKSIKNIILPDTLTYLGGEVFYNAQSLEYVRLSNNLTEIRGDSFEYCESLKQIVIPDSVTRIGGHAFYGASSLSEVVISPNSQLDEIGSSAFRLCSNLYNITIPSDTYVNDRAFKESPTTINRY